MKVLQVATLASSTGAYGGPIAVAQSQTKALRDQSVEAVLIAGQRAVDPPNLHEEWEHFVDVRRVLPTPGFTSYFSWSLFTGLWRAIGRAQVLHVQFGRELVPFAACVLAIVRRRPILAQCHGMVVPTTSRRRKLLDQVVFAPVLRRIRCFLVYDDAEAAGISTVAGKTIEHRQLLNGADLPPTWSETPSHRADEPWDVVFAARLHPRKRVGLFVELAQELAVDLGVQIRFTIYGADEGDGEIARSAAASGVLDFAGPLPLVELRDVLARADIYVLPSVHEPFSVTILDAQARGCPVVVSDSNGFAPYVKEWYSGAVFVSDDIASLTAAVRSMISDTGAYRSMRRQARTLVEREFSWEAVATELSKYYRAALGE